MLLKCNRFIFLQNSKIIFCNNCISCCDKAKLRSAKTVQYRDKLIVTVLHDINKKLGSAHLNVLAFQQACTKKLIKFTFFQLVPRPISTVKEGDWVVVIYEQEKFIGKVVNVVNGQAALQCLTKPLGINTPQDFEADTVYYTSIMP